MFQSECRTLAQTVEAEAKRLHGHNKLVAVLGGEHSTPLGLITALGKSKPGFGILHLDAHLDYRKAYEGMEHSHASIMYNAAQLPGVASIVSVGIRDYCQEEVDFAQQYEGAHVHYMHQLRTALFSGSTWEQQCQRMVEQLPNEVYISFDIDVLEPHLCPNTGTPVPGGLSFDQAAYLIEMVAWAGKEIIGFDLCEVAPGPQSLPAQQREWDGNVGARMLWHLSMVALRSRYVK